MALFDYEILDGPDAGQVIELEHSIKIQFETTLHNDRICKVKRLISGPGAFILKGSTWFRDGYEKGIQSK